MSSILFYSTRKSKILRKNNFRKKYILKKNGPSGALKGGTSEIVNIFVAVEGVLSQNTKKMKGGIFIFGKNLTVPKKLKGGPFGIFQHPFCAKTAKKSKGDPLRKKFSGKKSRSAEKKLEGGTLWSRRVWYVTRENRKNLSGSVR